MPLIKEVYMTSETIGEKLNYGRATTEAQKWATAEGKHAEMHLLRQAAILGAHAVMDHVGLAEVKEQDPQSVRGLEVVRISKLIPMGSDKSGWIEESRRSYAVPAPGPQGFRARLARRIAGEKTDEPLERSKLQLTAVKQGANGPETRVEMMSMMSNPNLDRRRNLISTPEQMINDYQSRIDQLVVFMKEVDRLALDAGAYIYSRHLGEYLDDREAGNQA
jgi:hypothetical protein